jgi:hypothetical protein
MQNVVYLHAEPTPIAQFLRVGTSGHRQLENFLAGGQLPSRRLVVGPSAFAKQKDLVAALQEGGREVFGSGFRGLAQMQQLRDFENTFRLH